MAYRLRRHTPFSVWSGPAAGQSACSKHGGGVMQGFKVLPGMAVAACVATNVTLVMASGAMAAHSKVLVVNVGAGQSYGSLQEAVDAASAGDTLTVRVTCVRSHTFINKNLAIEGEGRATLNGGNNELCCGFVVAIDEHTTVAITGITITGGGGGILGVGGSQLTLNNSTVSGNSYIGLKNFEGVATLNNSIVSRNEGNGIATHGDITLNNSIISGNGQEGIYVTECVAILNNSIVRRNSGKYGGGILAFAQLTLNNSTVTHNTTSENGAGIYNTGEVTLNNSTVTHNAASVNGGGIYSNPQGASPVTLNGSSSVSRNTASSHGGGIYLEGIGSVTLNDSSSVSRNVASSHGGGIYLSSFGSLISFGTGWSGTVSRNKPDDIFNE
jgi:hypothetical protein